MLFREPQGGAIEGAELQSVFSLEVMNGPFVVLLLLASCVSICSCVYTGGQGRILWETPTRKIWRVSCATIQPSLILGTVGNPACPTMVGHPQAAQGTLGHPGPASPCFFSWPHASSFSGLLYPLHLPFPHLSWIPSQRGHVGAPIKREGRGRIQTVCGVGNAPPNGGSSQEGDTVSGLSRCPLLWL